MTEHESKKAQEAEIVQEKIYNHTDSWNINRIFWGLLFVTIGGLMLAGNFNVISVDWINLWRLWPLIIISCGLSILTFRNLIWKLVSILLIIATMGAIVWVAVGGQTFSRPIHNYSSISKTISGTVKQAEVNVKAGASTLSVSTKDQTPVATSKLESNVTKLVESSKLSGSTQRIDLNMETVANNYWWTGDIKSNFEVQLARNLPIKLNIDAGASDTNIDVSKSKVSSVNLKIGASSLDIKLGNLVAQTDLNIESGVSSIIIRAPKDSGIQLKIESGMTSKDLSDLIDIGNNKFESSNYTTSTSKINIVAKIGISSFVVERY